MTTPLRDLADYADQYADLPFEATQVAFRRRLVLEVLEGVQARRVLEVGCGLDPLAPYASGFDAWTIVEPAERFADNAERLTSDDGRVRVIAQTIEAAAASGALGRGDFDVILLSSLLHEVPSPDAVLRGVHALCEAQTLVHCNVPNATSLHRQLAVAMGLVPHVSTPSPQQVRLQQGRIFDLASLEALLAQCGFGVIERGGYLLKPFTHAQMQGLVDGGTIDRQILEGLHALGKKFPELASEIFVNARRA